MFFLTKKLLIRAHNAFDEVNYKPDKGKLSLAAFRMCVVNTLGRTKDVQDSINVIRIYRYVASNFETIKKKIEKYYDFWEKLPYEGNELITLEETDEYMNIIVSNAFGYDYQKIHYCFSFDEDLELLELFRNGGRFFVDSDLKECNYSLRFSGASSDKMILQDKNNNILCLVTLSKDLDIFLENNKTDFDIVSYNGCMGIYKKQYLKSLGHKDPDLEECLAFLSWDIIDNKSDLGVAKIELFSSDADIEMLILFAAACFLNFRKYIRSYRIGSAVGTIAISRLLIRPR